MLVISDLTRKKEGNIIRIRRRGVEMRERGAVRALGDGRRVSCSARKRGRREVWK